MLLNALRFPILVFCAAAVLLPSSAYAAPTAKERAEAKSAWLKGKRFVTQEKRDEAVETLRIAVELDPKVQYQLDLARALVEAKIFIEARDLCDAIASSKEPNVQKAKQAAATLKKDLEPRIPTITVKLTGDAAGATASINGETVEIGKPLTFDPGIYTVRARMGDNPEVSERVELAERAKKTVTLDPSTGAPPAEEPKEGSSGGTMAPAAIAFGVGGAALVAGGVTGFLAFQKTDEVTDLCGGTSCPEKYAGDVQTAQDFGTASTVLFALGGIGATAGLILTFTVGMDGDAPSEDSTEKKKEEAQVWVTPYVGPFHAGLVGTF